MAVFKLVALMAASPLLIGAAEMESEWNTIDDFDPDISFSLPCDRSEIDRREEGAIELGGVSRKMQCSHEGIGFSVSITETGVGVDAASLFDTISKELNSKKSSDVETIQLDFGQLRQVSDRSTDRKILGQRAVVEVNRSKIALVMAVGSADEHGDAASLQRAIDKFFSSLSFVS